MSKFDVRWRSRELAPPWKRILSFFCDIVVLSPPVLLVAGARSFNPFPGVSLTYWILCSLWGWYTFIFGIGLPLYKGISSRRKENWQVETTRSPTRVLFLVTMDAVTKFSLCRHYCKSYFLC
jgi:hypothetical protein